MRISDLSSDVCSSDLRQQSLPSGERFVGGRRNSSHPCRFSFDMPGIWQNATIFSLTARGILVEISAVRLLYHIFERMWSHFWTEPRPARLHLFAAAIVPVDRTTHERTTSGSQNGPPCLAPARHAAFAEHAASQS